MAPPDKAEIQWILDALAQDAAKTRKGLGEAINLDKTGVSKMLSGKRALKMREGVKIAAYLGVSSPAGFAEEAPPFNLERKGARDAPIFRVSAEQAEPFWRLHRRDGPIDWKSRGPHFAGATQVFGFYAPDEAMAPRFKRGELTFVDPARLAGPGDDALFIETTSDEGPERAILGEVAKLSPTLVSLKQYGRVGEQRLPVKGWAAALVMRVY